MTKRKLLLNWKKKTARLNRKLRKFFFKKDFNLKLSLKKKDFKSLFISLRKRRLVLILFLPLFFYYLVSFLLVSSESICLESLRLSFLNNDACREQCYLDRLNNKKCIIANLEEGSSLEKKIFSYLKDESLDFSFRQEMLEIIKSLYAEKEAPLYLVTYLESASGDNRMKAEIFSAFDWEMVGSSPLSYYLAILESDTSLELRLAAALKISSYNKKSSDFKLADLEILESVIFRNDTDSYLRQSLVLLLSDYHNFYPEETALLFNKILAANFRNDNISRAFAADFIKEPLPEVSDLEWDRYYQR